MDIISDVLSLLKLESTIYFRTAFFEPWGIRVPTFENVARFHFVHRGRCWITVGDNSVELNQGDLVIIPHGADHTIHDPIDAKIESLKKATAEYLGEGVFCYGEKGNSNDTQLVCGHWSFDPNISHPLIDTLPPLVHIKRSNKTSSWLEHSLEMIGYETEMQQPGYQQIAKKLSETIFTYAIRNYLTAESENSQFYGALRDKKILNVLQALHQSPSHSWDLESMSSVANLSRTGFINRFTKLVGMTPLQYLTHWRMQIGCRLLLDSDCPIIDIAEKVGYQSEAAFGRVFKKHFNIGPSGYRRHDKLNYAAED
ncbi:MAG: AraC family transcriptional regulator [Ectothiorhodospiraceae bacterium]|nr:AraC family transcriptional regulator [Ectothiorhodospiraceae bacterium]